MATRKKKAALPLVEDKYERDTKGSLINKDNQAYAHARQRKLAEKESARNAKRIKQLERKIAAFEKRISKLENK